MSTKSSSVAVKRSHRRLNRESCSKTPAVSSHARKFLSPRSEYFTLDLPHASFSSLFLLVSGVSVSHNFVETRVSDFVNVFAAVLRRSFSHRSAAPCVRFCMPSRRIARLFFGRRLSRSSRARDSGA